MSSIPPSDTIFEQPVMWPTASATIGSTKALRLAEHRALKEYSDGGGSCELSLADQAGLSLPDVDAFIAAPPDAKPLVPVTLTLGYKGFGEWVVFTGWLAEAEYGPRRLTARLTVLDDLPLRAMRITKFAVEKQPQDIVAALLAAAGWTAAIEVDLSGAATLKKDVAKNETALDLLGRLRDTAKIRFPWWIDAAGRFIWTPWYVMGSEKTYIFRRQVNVVSLIPNESDETADQQGQMVGAFWLNYILFVVIR